MSKGTIHEQSFVTIPLMHQSLCSCSARLPDAHHACADARAARRLSALLRVRVHAVLVESRRVHDGVENEAPGGQPRAAGGAPDLRGGHPQGHVLPEPARRE